MNCVSCRYLRLSIIHECRSPRFAFSRTTHPCREYVLVELAGGGDAVTARLRER